MTGKDRARGRSRVRRQLSLVLIAATVAVVVSAASTWWARTGPSQAVGAEAPPLVGFSFSPVTAEYYGDNPRGALESLLGTLAPDIVRIPVFWDRVEPARGRFDFRELDGLLAAVAAHDRLTPARPTRVVLIVGARNIGYPEVHFPGWIPAATSARVSTLVADPAYTGYLQRTVARYAASSLLAAWQVENEPMDEVASPVASVTSVPAEDLSEDVATIHRIDNDTPVIMTTFNNSTLSLDLDAMSAPHARRTDHSGATPVGHPLPSLQMADMLGLDAYVAVGGTSLADAGVAQRVQWKVAALQYWAEEARTAGKALWITEMQAEPWPGKHTFGPDDLVLSAREYRKVGAGAILLWGVESWLHDPLWMAAGQRARAALGG